MTPLRSEGFHLAEHYLSGHIVGTTWSGFNGCLPVSCPLPLRNEGKLIKYEYLLKLILRAKGGDFQNPKFSGHTGIVLIRRRFDSPGIYVNHKRTLILETVFPSLVAEEHLWPEDDGDYQ